MMPAAIEPACPALTHVHPAQVCGDQAWESAYRRFESPAQEIAKFRGRLRWFGADLWDSDLEIVELFCGRGNALVAWRQLGFTRIVGVDLSASLLAEYRGPARCYVADCRSLPLETASRDVVAVHGGLHHLPNLATDLPRVLDEARRVLRPGGQLLVVEPWNTPFLRAVHTAAANRLARQASSRLDAFQQLYEHERQTYDQWLAAPQQILAMFRDRFRVDVVKPRWGKLYLLARKAEGAE